MPGRLPDPWSDLADLGDIFLGMPYIYNQCIKDGTTVEAVLPAIITHGFCHLMGFDHENKEQWLEVRETACFNWRCTTVTPYNNNNNNTNNNNT